MEAEGRVRKIVGDDRRGNEVVGVKVGRAEVVDLEGVVRKLGGERMEEQGCISRYFNGWRTESRRSK